MACTTDKDFINMAVKLMIVEKSENGSVVGFHMANAAISENFKVKGINLMHRDMLNGHIRRHYKKQGQAQVPLLSMIAKWLSQVT